MFHQLISATDGGVLSVLCLAVTMVGVVSLPWREPELTGSMNSFAVLGSLLFAWCGVTPRRAHGGSEGSLHGVLVGRNIRFHRGATGRGVMVRRAA